jgi:nickel-type superoxide dismutase maturation protease
MRRTRGLLGPLVACLGLWLVLRRRVDVVEVRGRSMIPALWPGDRLVVLRVRTVRPGHVVLAPDPRAPGRELVKRVAAVDPTAVLVAGDNAAESTDTRTFGPVRRDAVRWRAVWRYWPPGRVGRISRR